MPAPLFQQQQSANGAVQEARSTAAERRRCFAGCNPLALVLAAAVVASRPGARGDVASIGQILVALLNRLVGDVPPAPHRRALEAAARAFTMTEDLLRAALPGEDASQLFGWLHDLPFMNVLHEGVHPHDAVRETLVADLRWRDLESISADAGTPARATVRQTARGTRPGSGRRWVIGFSSTVKCRPRRHVGRRGPVQDEPVRAEDVPAVLGFAAESEGRASAELVRHWLHRQPVVRRYHLPVPAVSRSMSFSVIGAACPTPSPVARLSPPVDLGVR